MSEQTPAGWYPDPERTNTQRYWDGSAWSDHLAPSAPIAPPNGTPSVVRAAAAVIVVAGMLVALLLAGNFIDWFNRVLGG